MTVRRRSYHSQDAFRKPGGKICVTDCQIVSGVSASRRRTRAKRRFRGRIGRNHGNRKRDDIDRIVRQDDEMRRAVGGQQRHTRSTAGSDNVSPHGASGRRSTRTLGQEIAQQRRIVAPSSLSR
jgi:hypothetical protein